MPLDIAINKNLYVNNILHYRAFFKSSHLYKKAGTPPLWEEIPACFTIFCSDYYSAFLPAAALKVSATLAIPCNSAGSRIVVA